MSMEELTLSEAETRALLLSPSPMAILYDKFSDLETGYMDTIRDSIEDTARDEAKRLKELPVYPLSRRPCAGARGAERIPRLPPCQCELQGGH